MLRLRCLEVVEKRILKLFDRLGYDGFLAEQHFAETLRFRQLRSKISLPSFCLSDFGLGFVRKSYLFAE